ncbi:MAG TPA: tRNA pseudouridine(38-40) synthase TruA [Rectinemataceae bacterium]|nr:tRNA pseudouridine(38-40) synthase TruA [Rectinemataceae bacterium]
MGRKNYLVEFAYDGTDYEGWQRLPDGKPSLQAVVEKAVSAALGEPIEVTGASRTDRGVHAEGQAASFHSRSPKPQAAILAALDRELPPDIVARSIREVDPRFHARFRAKSKLYRYRLHVGGRPDPFARRYSHHVAGPLDLEAMRSIGRMLEGEHDFSAFTNAKDAEARRGLEAVRVEAVSIGGGGAAGIAGGAASGGENAGIGKALFVDLYFEGKSFLYNQVRIMAAALLAAGEGRLAPEAVSKALVSGDRSLLPGALGAWGLCLVKVRYSG